MKKYSVFSSFMKDIVFISDSIEGCFNFIEQVVTCEDYDISEDKLSIYNRKFNKLIRFGFDDSLKPFQILDISDRGGMVNDAFDSENVKKGKTIGLIACHDHVMLATTIARLKKQEINVVVVEAKTEETPMQNAMTQMLKDNQKPLSLTLTRIDPIPWEDQMKFQKHNNEPFWRGLGKNNKRRW